MLGKGELPKQPLIVKAKEFSKLAEQKEWPSSASSHFQGVLLKAVCGCCMLSA